ncbi:hypothetical protein B0919_20340 [Hymenobacter sp. CRA2]|nr:hypothetical protein B0919_20340 [Hymenobacter sp. CRA2]
MAPGATPLPRHYQSAFLEYALYYNFLRNTRRLAVAVGIGPYLGYTHKQDYLWVTYGYNPASTQPGTLAYEKYRVSGVRIGALLSLHVGVAIDKHQRWRLESEGIFQRMRGGAQLGLILKTSYRLYAAD